MALDIPDLNAFGLSRTKGFLSNDPPVLKFSNNYYEKWDDLISKLPNLISSHKINDEIQHLPILNASNLSSELEFRRAYVVLAFLVHAYVWGSTHDGKPVETIPPQLSEPFLHVCGYLGLQPVLSYAGLCLWNWVAEADAKQGPESLFFELQELKSFASFTGTRGEDAFYHVPVLIEAEGGPLIPLLLDAIAAAQKEDIAFVTEVLDQTAQTFIRMALHLPKMYPVLDAEMFFHKLRPFLSGGTGMVFQTSDKSKIATKCIGGSAAQSSLFQFLDYVLGVQHEGSNDGQKSVFEVNLKHLTNEAHPFH
jgi:indoleamine 2,3-dioxygenase